MQSATATRSSEHERSSTDRRVCTHFCLHRSFLRCGTQRPRNEKTKAKKEVYGVRAAVRRGEGGRKGKMDLAECIIAALHRWKAHSCLAREASMACNLKYECVSLCNKRTRAARKICVTYAYNAAITSDERKKERRKGKNTRETSRNARSITRCALNAHIYRYALLVTFFFFFGQRELHTLPSRDKLKYLFVVQRVW